MNNLKQLKIRFLPVHDIQGEIIHISLGLDKKNKEVYYLRNECLIHVDLVKGLESSLVTEIQDVIRTEFMSGHNKISITTKNSIFIIDCDTKKLFKKDFDEIHQTSWTDSYDYLAVVFKDGQLRTYLFDTTYEMMDHGSGDVFTPVPQQQAVGWGSTSTQFQGPSVHEERTTTEPHLRPADNGAPVVSWRGNGDEFIVSYMENEMRVFKVFDNTCVPKCFSELSAETGKLYGPIAWKPEGGVIAAAMYKNDKNCIALFERNGLYRMDFPLVDIFHPITRLSWSSCGRALIVSQEDNTGISHVCIYTTCNMKWFLKQHLVFYKNNPLITFDWVPTDQQCLELQTVTKRLVMHYKYRFGFDTDSKHNMIAAVNGKTIRIHGFSKSVDPSPSCTSLITLCNPVNMVAFHPSQDLFAAIDSLNNIFCFKINGFDLNCTVQSSLTNPTFPLRVNHLFWKGDNPFLLVDNPSECSSTLYEFSIASAELLTIQVFDVTHYAVEHIYAVDNVVIKHDAKYRTTHTVTETPVTIVNALYPLEVIPLKYDHEIFFFVLTPSQDLFLDDEFLCTGVTSVLIYNDFLLITDNTNLYTLKLSRQVLDTLAMDGLPVFHCRPLNELAYVMCMLGNTSQVVLHTPRGNLEIIGCRAMQVRAIEDMLVKGDWGEAIKLMRLSRTCWNLLIDLNPERFYANISKVVSESNSQHTLNAMVAEVNDENCLATIYKNAIDIVPYITLNKRREFLDKLSDYLDKSGAYLNYLPTVIKVCMDQNNIKKAMNYLSFFMNSPSDMQQRKAEQALKQMKMQVEPMDLFQAALLTYDINLADYVAKMCQINPQEVGPLLEELRKLDSIEKRIAIHVKYQNWEMAIAYMINRENRDKDEILQFIQEHNVAKKAYIEAIKIKELDFMEDIALLYAQKLIRKKYHNEAAIILVKYLLFDDAVEQFKMALEHKKCIEYIHLTSLSENAKRQFFIELAGKLIVAQRIQDAAMIYETQLEDYDAALKTLTNGRLFTDALRIAKEHFLGNMIDIYILPKMFNMVQRIREIVDDTSVRFKKRLDRLIRLRSIKKHEFEIIMKRNSGVLLTDQWVFRRKRPDGLEGPSHLDSDVHSVISAGTHRSSRSNRSSRSTTSTSTTVTQKQIRKMEKQRQDTTEGSRFEDIALMRELHIMITLIFKFGPEAKELFMRLIEYSIMDLTVLQEHHHRLFNLQMLMKNEVHNIWDEEFRSSPTVNYINENYLFMDEIFRSIPSEVENPGLSWALTIFK